MAISSYIRGGGGKTLSYLLFALAVAVFAAIPARADGAKRPMALMIMVDGLRADASQTGDMPNLERLRTGKWQPGYKAAWSVTGHIAPGTVPSSAPNHVSIATGFTPAEHGVNANSVLEGGTASSKPTWLKRVMDAKSGATGLFVYSWSPDGNIAPSEGFDVLSGTDAANATALAARLASAEAPDATMYFINCADEAGHSSGFYPMSTAYRAELAAADGYIGACLDAVASRPTFAEEDWLVLVTSDHGGYNKYHGQITENFQAHTVPIVIAGTGVTAGRIPGIPYNYDVAANALAHFGVDTAGLRATARDGVAEPARTLNDGLAAYLPFNDSTTGNKVAGSSVTPAVGGGSPALAANGFAGKYLNLPSGAYLRLAGSENLTYEDDDKSFTAVLWVNMSSTPTSDPVAIGNKNWGGGANKGVLLCAGKSFTYSDTTISNQRSFSLNAGTGSARLDIGPFDLEKSKWTFYAITRNDDGVFTIYQGRSDGTLDWASAPLDGFTLKSGYPFCIGQDGTGSYGNKFVGAVDDAALWTRGLSHDDIRRIYENGRAGMELGDLLEMDAKDAPTMEVAAAEEGEYTLIFGGRRTLTHALYVAYGAADAGSDKYAWDSFAKVADIPAATTTYTYTVPDGLKAANAKFRFFLLQTENLPYAKEVAYTQSGGTAWLDTGIAPRSDLVAEFDMRFTADNTEWNTGKTAAQVPIYENIFGAFCGNDKRGNYGMCRHRQNGNANDRKWDREYNNGTTYQFSGERGECVNDTDYHVVFTTTNLVVNGTAYGSGIALSSFIEGGYGIALYRNLKNGAIYDDTMIGFFRSFALYTPKRKVRDYAPAVDANGVAGLFDRVTGRFQSSAGDAFEAGADLDAARAGWVRCVSEESYDASDTKPVTADYTGLGANPLDFTDSGNWICKNVYGNTLEGVVPTAETAVAVAGETPFAVPQGTAMFPCASIRFDYATPASPDGADWRGLDLSKIAAGSTVDLKGRELVLSGLHGNAASAAKFTDSSTDAANPGVLAFEINAGTNMTNGALALEGNLKLAKRGGGVLVLAKTGQTYSGGTEISDGKIRLDAIAGTNFGTGSVRVLPGGRFDMNAKDASAVSLVLAGGVLESSGTSAATAPKVLSLEADSTVEYTGNAGGNDINVPAGCRWNLGGKTLSIVMSGNDSDFVFVRNDSQNMENVVSNGNLVVSEVGTAGTGRGFVAIRRLDGRDGLKLDTGKTCLRLQTSNYDSYVQDYTADPPAPSSSYKPVAYNYQNRRLHIYGVYTPPVVHAGFNMTMEDGSTLDLSGKSGSWNCTFSSVKAEYADGSAYPCTLQFASGTVTVKLEGRTDLKTIAKSGSPYVVVWGSKPSNTKFVLDAATAERSFKMQADDTGLKLIAPRGFVLTVR